MTTISTTSPPHSTNLDYIVVGAGPSGLAFAHSVGRAGKSVLVLERELVAGGCHRVKRAGTDHTTFTEHGPRIYSAAYKTFQSLLQDMGLDFYQLFSPQYVHFFRVGGINVVTAFGIKEIFRITYAFWKLMWNLDYGKNTTMAEFTQEFNPKAREVLERLCRITDGAGMDRYSLNQFLHMLNQQSLYLKVYLPNQPTDEELFPKWTHFLESKLGVKFRYGVDVVAINRIIDNQNNIVSFTIPSLASTTKLQLQFADQTTMDVYPEKTKIIFAIPPIFLVNILRNSNYDPFGVSFHQFAERTKYNVDLTVTLEWKHYIDFFSLQNFPPSDFGIYMLPLFTQKAGIRRKTSIVSVGVTMLDRKNSHGKTANECTEDEIKAEILHALRFSMPSLPDPATMTLNPNQTRSVVDGQWIDRDSGFVGREYVPFEASPGNPSRNNVYTLGSQNGHAAFYFTSLETAMSNAVTLANKLHPGQIMLKPKVAWKITDVLTGWYHWMKRKL
jgi:hypothetical protein